MPVDSPDLVLLHVWGLAPTGLPRALARIPRDRRSLRRVPGLRFAKLLGTGRGNAFTVKDTDPLHWALVTSWESADAAARFERGSLVGGWTDLSRERLVARMQPLSSRGEWSGVRPFGEAAPPSWVGPVSAITRARIAPRKLVTFWRAVPSVALEVNSSPGLRLAMGIGELPVGLQGTFSLWESSDALTSFAYGRPMHLEAVRRTPNERWFVEELFARFGVLSVEGTYRGRTP